MFFHIKKEAKKERELAHKKWMSKLRLKLIGRDVSFTGNKWEDKPVKWLEHTVCVRRVRDSTCGNIFPAEIVIEDFLGNIYTIISESIKIKIE